MLLLVYDVLLSGGKEKKGQGKERTRKRGDKRGKLQGNGRTPARLLAGMAEDSRNRNGGKHKRYIETPNQPLQISRNTSQTGLDVAVSRRCFFPSASAFVDRKDGREGTKRERVAEKEVRKGGVEGGGRRGGGGVFHGCRRRETGDRISGS